MINRLPRVLLVYPTPIKPTAFFGYVLPPLGLERIAAALLTPPGGGGSFAPPETAFRAASHGGKRPLRPSWAGGPLAEVKILDLRFEGDGWLDAARTFAPDWVGVNVKTTMYADTSYHVADRLRANLPAARFVLGGLHASSIPEEAIGHGDVVAVGEGEEIFCELVQGRPLPEIQGILWRTALVPATPANIDDVATLAGAGAALAAGATLAHHGSGRSMFSYVVNPARALLTDLDRLPPPARHLRPAHYRYEAAKLIKMDLLETSRGCTQYCPFCSGAVVNKGKWRGHSADYVFAEVKRLAAAGVKYVMLTDDHFSADLERVERICDLIVAADIKIAFFCFLRPLLGRMDLKRKMVAAGFVMLSYGAESPNRKQLEKYGKGFVDPEQFIRQVNREWHEAGARYIGNSYVFGDPDEARADLERLGDYARDLDPTFVEPLYAQPYPGTRYRATLEERGLLLPHTWADFTEGRMIARHPELDADALRSARVRLWLRFFSPRKLVGAFRVPLYLHDVIGIPTRTVLKYMKACDYSVFGCILEDKFYLHRKRAMVRRYLTDHINTFPAHERDMTLNVDAFTDMIGLGRLKKCFGTGALVVAVVDAGRARPVTRFAITFAEGRITRVVAGLEPVPAGARVVRVRLDDLVELMCAHDFGKFAALVRTAWLNLWVGDRP